MKNKNFIIIVIGQIISLFGNAIQRFSMSLYLLEFTGSTGAFARILAISTIPYIIFAPIAGRLSDKINRKKIMVYLDFFSSILIGGYALILLRGHDSEFIVGTVMFILSICFTLYGPAVTSSIPQVVEEDSLTSANGVINQVGSIVNFAGPILAGVLYGLLGIKIIVIINSVSFFISAVMELFLDIPDVVRVDKENTQNNIEEMIDEKNEEIDSESYKKINSTQDTNKNRFELITFIKNSFLDMKNTLVYLKRENKVVLGIIISYALGNIFLVPILSIVAPYFINILLGLPSQVYGVVEAVCVLGMILGGFWISVKPKMFSIKKVHYTYLPMIGGVAFMSLLGFTKMNNYVAAGTFALCGMAIMLSLSLSNVLTLTFIQKQVPEYMLGSVSAFSTAVATISVAPGQLLFGQLIDFGIPMGILLGVTAIANIGVVLFVRWNVRKIEN
ncbi:MAG: MFS transporter [Clostridium sp.]|nr:MFS transporter [Clostridium sp.]